VSEYPGIAIHVINPVGAAGFELEGWMVFELDVEAVQAWSWRIQVLRTALRG
jgi:hypothetical protein